NLSKRLSSTLHAGEELRSFQAGQKATSPYVESALSYRYAGGTSVMSWTSRYGLEESSSAAQSKTGFHSSLSFSQVLSARLQGALSLSYAHTTTSALTSTNSETSTATPTAASTTSTSS